MIDLSSDYIRGAHPLVLQALIESNHLSSSGYGTDNYTTRAKELILDACGLSHGEVFFLVGGTQTNATVIDALLRHCQGVIATDTAHISVHESGAIEATGHKVLALPHHEGKLGAEQVQEYIQEYNKDDTNEHMVAPAMVYISQPTELGTLYSRSELEQLSKVCQEANIPLYIDGARLGYALASPEASLSLEDIARLSDIFYIGGTKVGTLFGEAVVTRRPELLPRFRSLIKQHGALLAKGRLLGVQFERLFTDGLYLTISRHAVEMAMKLKAAFLDKGYRLYIDSPTNQQFFLLPNDELDRLMQYAHFQLWGTRGDEVTAVRFVTDWSTDEQELDAFLAKL